MARIKSELIRGLIIVGVGILLLFLLAACFWQDVEVYKIADIEEFKEKLEQLANPVLPGKQFEPYLIDLPVRLQEYTWRICQENNLDFELFLGLMHQESGFREDVVSATNDYGICQINEVNHAWLGESLGVTDFLDAEQNILAAAFILAGYKMKYVVDDKVLMCYNQGEAGAISSWERGVMSTEYSRSVKEYAVNLMKERQ